MGDVEKINSDPIFSEEIETWMTAPAEEALKLQRPLPDGTLRIVATGTKEDGEVVVAL